MSRPIEQDLSSERRRVTAEAPIPEGEAEDDLSYGRFEFLLGPVISTEQRLDPEQREKGCGHLHPREPFGRTVAGQVNDVIGMRRELV